MSGFALKIGVVASLGIVGSIAFAVACDDDHLRTSPEQAAGGGGACEAKPGDLPAADCDNSQKSCGGTGCEIDQARCGSITTCMPLGENKGKDIIDLRFRRLNIAAPAALNGSFIQNNVVNRGIDLQEPKCAESGTGLFTWIMRIDKTSQTILTGGAPPSADPFGKGFCFASFTLNGTKVQPLTGKIELKGNTFKTLERANVNIPIFLSEKLESAIILPISDARIENVTLSNDGNCVGNFVAGGLDTSCTEDRELCPKWQTAGALGGYITLEQADTVLIRDLGNKSLCAFLASDANPKCTRDPANKVSYKGDYCSTTKQPGGCQDSVWLAATFAASAVKIFDGKGTVDGCSGLDTAPDAGADAGGDAAITDASGDADANDQ